MFDEGPLTQGTQVTSKPLGLVLLPPDSPISPMERILFTNPLPGFYIYYCTGKVSSQKHKTTILDREIDDNKIVHKLT